MAGRVPKAKENRVRVNKTMGATLPKEGSGRAAPPMPEGSFTPYARNYWEIIWSSPMGGVYLDADIPALIRLTELVNQWTVLGEKDVLAEIRQLEDRFGLSPLSRRRLEWEISQVAKPEDAAPPSSDEDERWLKAVG